MTKTVTYDDLPMHPTIARVPLLRSFSWIRRGWQDLQRHWAQSLGYGGLTVAIGWVVLVFCGTHPYLIAAAISVFLLLAPPMSAGLCEISRLQSLGKTANFDDSLNGFMRNRAALFKFGGLLAGMAVAWFAISGVVLDAALDVTLPQISATRYHGFFNYVSQWQMLTYVGVGATLAASVFSSSVISVPMIIDRHCSASEAMMTSLKVLLANWPAMVAWATVILVLTILGFASMLIGLLVISPLLGHSSWHAYKDMVP